MTRRPLLRESPVATMLAAFALLATVGACGGASDADRREDLADDLVAETGGALDDDKAACVADGLYDAFDDDSIDRVVAVAEGDEDDDEVRQRVVDVFTECDALAAVAGAE